MTTVVETHLKWHKPTALDFEKTHLVRAARQSDAKRKRTYTMDLRVGTPRGARTR